MTDSSPAKASRAHVRSFQRDASQLSGGGNLGDASSGTTGGFRADWSRGADAFLLIAGLYTGTTDDRQTYGSAPADRLRPLPEKSMRQCAIGREPDQNSPRCVSVFRESRTLSGESPTT